MGPVIPTVVTRHAEEAAFLWLLRRRAVREPHYTLRQFAELDERVEAHLDGLRIAGDAGWEIAVQQLEAAPEVGEIFAAGVLAMEDGRTARVEVVRKAVETAPKNAAGLVSALGWLPASVAVERTTPWRNADPPVWRCVAIAAAAVHRRDPGPFLQSAIEDRTPEVRSRALRAAGELGAAVCLPALRRHSSATDPACRFWASWSAARLGDKGAASELQEIAQAERRLDAVNVAVRAIEPSAASRWLATLAHLPGAARLALQGFGLLGDPVAAPRLLESMAAPPLARAAGEAFTFITGVDLDVAKLAGKRPEGFDAGPNDNPADENVALDPDENLPWPDPERVKSWWSANRGQFAAGTRYLLGKPMTPDWLRQVLRDGKQRHRAAAALELAVREPNKPLFNVAAPGFRQ